MKKVVVVARNGNLSTRRIKECTVEKLFKACGFRKNEGFSLRNTWKYQDSYVSAFARDRGRAGTENKYEMPPPLDTPLYFGSMVLVRHRDEEIADACLLGFY